MKKALCCLLVLATLAALLTGCSKKTEDSIFRANDEIYTYRRIDPDKTQIVVSRTGNINVESMCREFEELNPDIQVIYIDITGGNPRCKPLIDWVEHGYAPDIVISAAGFFDDELTKKYFKNLSADPIIQNYQMEALHRTATQSDIYWLPGPSDMSAMMYNKTLFAKYGWQVPTTFDEFVALCDRIKQDTNGEIEPWNPNAKYDGELTLALQCMTYDELFAGVDNYSWYNDLFKGKATLTGHMEPYVEVIQTLVDHGILREEHFTYSATTRGIEFAEGKIAMVNMNIYNADNENYKFGYMPFPTTQGQLGYVCSNYSCYVGVPVKEHTEKQAKAVEKFLEYFSSPQGQTTYIGGSMKISNVKGVKLSGSNDLSALQPAIDAGHQFTMLSFYDPAGSNKSVFLYRFATDIAIEGKSGAECLAQMDESLAAPAQVVQEEPPKVIGTIKDDMTTLDTSFYIADTYRKATDADIALITTGEVFRGNVMRLFDGDVTPDTVNVLKPRSFANGSTLLKVNMTGSQIMDALNNPVGNNVTADCVYAYSGLKCEIAPWNPLGSKYLSVKLENGSKLENDKLYTVAIWAGTVADEYITETLETYEGTWEDIMTARISEEKEVSFTDDKRIKLVWN